MRNSLSFLIIELKILKFLKKYFGKSSFFSFKSLNFFSVLLLSILGRSIKKLKLPLTILAKSFTLVFGILLFLSDSFATSKSYEENLNLNKKYDLKEIINSSVRWEKKINASYT